MREVKLCLTGNNLGAFRHLSSRHKSPTKRKRDEPAPKTPFGRFVYELARLQRDADGRLLNLDVAAKRLGVGRQALGDWVRGGTPETPSLRKLSANTGIPLSALGRVLEEPILSVKSLRCLVEYYERQLGLPDAGREFEARPVEPPDADEFGGGSNPGPVRGVGGV